MNKENLQQTIKEFLSKDGNSSINEATLSKAQLDKREDIIKDLKKNKKELVKRYGKDAEAVMYGRATNLAKKAVSEMNKEKLKELVRKSLMNEADLEVDADRFMDEKDLSQASMMLDDLQYKVDNHDWFFMMSDDPRSYDKGSNKDKEIRNLINKLESIGYGMEAKQIYNSSEPYSKSFGRDAKLKEGKKEDMDGDGDIDSKDYLAKRDAAIQKAKGEVKEDQYIDGLGTIIAKSIDMTGSNPLNQKIVSMIAKLLDIHRALVSIIMDDYPEVAKDSKIVKYFNDFNNVLKTSKADLKNSLKENMSQYSVVSEDTDLGHEDDEPHMIKAELYRIGKYAMELYQMVDQFEGPMEVDFPAWWQSKITTAANNMVSAKHYLDFELKEPAIDNMLGVGDDEYSMMEGEIGKDEMLAGKIAKALKSMANKDSSDQSNLKQARIALNKGNIEAAEKIAKPYLSEKILQKLKSK